MKKILLIALLFLIGCGGGGYYTDTYKSYNSPVYDNHQETNDTWYVDTNTGQPYIPLGDNLVNPSTGDVYYNYPNNWKVGPTGTYKPFGNWYVDENGNTLVPLR